MKKQFHIGNIVSISTGILIPSPEDEHAIDGVYKILNFLFAADIMTHQIGHFLSKAKPILSEQLPFLDKVELKKMNPKEALRIRDGLEQKYGAFHFIEQHQLGLEGLHENINKADKILSGKKVYKIILPEAE